MKLAMVGLGCMGANVALRVIEAGHEIIASDRLPEKASGARRQRGGRCDLRRGPGPETGATARYLADDTLRAPDRDRPQSTGSPPADARDRLD